jgi:Rad52/22 family double-strand break repair protein
MSMNDDQPDDQLDDQPDDQPDDQEDHEMSDKEREIALSDQTEIKAGAETGAKTNDSDWANSTQSAQIVPLAFTNLLRTLRQPIDSRLIKAREGWTDRQGNTHWVEYIEWHTVADILDRVAPDWSHAVRNITQIGDVVAVTAAITIDGVTREGVGTGPADTETGIKKAEHDALKRAAVKFGVARDLYRRESDVIEDNSAIPPGIARDPRPKTLGDLVTPKQLWMIRGLGREIGCDVEQECQSLLQCNLEEISKRAASSFIDYLKRLQQENQPEEMRQAS